MKWLTRQWYDSIQGLQRPPTAGEIEDWSKPIASYKEHFSAILESLPEDLRKLTPLRFHDALFLSVDECESDCERRLTLELECGERHSPTNSIRYLEFGGIESATLPERLAGKSWLYEEIQEVGTAFRLSILCDSEEVEILFSRFRFRC